MPITGVVGVRNRSVLFTAGFGLLCVLVLAFTTPMGTDYPQLTQRVLDRLAVGDFGAYFAEQPQMGQLSLLLRWPAAAFGGSDLAVYRLGALICLIGPLLLAVGLGGRQTVSRAAMICVALIANPVTVRALELGHPEELLGAALCAGSLLAAVDDRPIWAGLLLGLALATKQWAIFAVLPVLFAVDSDRRIHAGGVAVLIASALTLPLLVDPRAFVDAIQHPATGVIELRPGNVWSLVLGPQANVSLGGGETVAIANVPGWLRQTAHPAIIVLCFAIAFAGRHYVSRKADMFVLLALVFLARCFFDPWNHEYYHAPLLAALCCWEVVGLRRAPLLTIGSSAVLWLVFEPLAGSSGESLLADIVYVSWAAAIGGTLVYALRNPFKPAADHRAAVRSSPGQSGPAVPAR